MVTLILNRFDPHTTLAVLGDASGCLLLRTFLNTLKYSSIQRSTYLSLRTPKISIFWWVHSERSQKYFIILNKKHDLNNKFKQYIPGKEYILS